MSKTRPREKIRKLRDIIPAVLLLLGQTVHARATTECFMRALVFSTLLSLFTPRAFSQEHVPAPAFKDGDFWQFKVTEDVANLISTKELDGIYELVRDGGMVKGFQLTGDQKLEVALDPDDRTGALLGLLGLNGKRPDLRFPLSVGQKWNYSYQFRPTGSRRLASRNVEVQVVAIESVTIQAGTFRAFKIISDSNWSSGGRGPTEAKNSTSTFFYSPETKSIVKASQQSSEGSIREIELIKTGSEAERR